MNSNYRIRILSYVNKERILLSIYLITLSFFIVMQSTNSIWHKGDVWTDSAVFKYVAYEMQNGNMPYLDTFDHKGPLIYFINIAGNLIDSWRGIWYVEFLSMFAGLLFIYKVAKLYCNTIVSSVLTFLVTGYIFKYFEGGNLVEEYAIPFIAIGIYIFLKYLNGAELKNYEFTISGGAFSCILLLRPNMGILWPVMCIGILVELLIGQNYQELIKIMKRFVFGMSIILAPVIIWLCVRGAIQSFIEAYFQYNIKYTEALSVSNSRYTAVSYYLSDDVAAIAAMAVSILAVMRHRMRDIIYAVFFFTNIILISMAGKISMHYGMIIVPTLIYPLAAAISEIDGFSKGKDTVAMGIGVILLLLLSPYVVPGWMSAITNAFGQFPGKNRDYISDTNRQIADLVVQNSNKDDQITVCGNWNIIYLLSNRKSASRYSYQTVCSIDEEMQDEYFDDLKENPPEIIVLRNDFYPMEKMTAYLETESYYDIGGDDEKAARVLKRSSVN